MLNDIVQISIVVSSLIIRTSKNCYLNSGFVKVGCFKPPFLIDKSNLAKYNVDLR